MPLNLLLRADTQLAYRPMFGLLGSAVQAGVARNRRDHQRFYEGMPQPHTS